MSNKAPDFVGKTKDEIVNWRDPNGRIFYKTFNPENPGELKATRQSPLAGEELYYTNTIQIWFDQPSNAPDYSYGFRDYEIKIPINPPPPFRLPNTSTATLNEEIISESFQSSDDNRLVLQNQKPEILLMTEFSPLKNSLGEDTPVGSYFDLILSSRKIKLQKTFEDLQSISKESPELSRYFKDLYSQNIKVIELLNENLLRTLEIFKTQESFLELFDVKSNFNEIDYDITFSKIFGDENKDINVDEPYKINFNDFLSTDSDFKTSNVKDLVKKLSSDIGGSDFVPTVTNPFLFLDHLIVAKNIKLNNINYRSYGEIIGSVFGNEREFEDFFSDRFRKTGEGLVNNLRKENLFFFDTEKISNVGTRNSFDFGYRKILESTVPISENEFQFDSESLTNLESALQKMDLIRDCGLIHYSEKNDGRKINLTSSESFIDYLFGLFFNDQGVLKFSEDEDSAVFISFMTKHQNPQGNERFKNDIFDLIMLDFVEDGVVDNTESGETFSSKQNEIINKLYSSYRVLNEPDSGYFDKRDGLTNPITLTKENAIRSFSKTPVVYSQEFDISVPEGLSLYKTIAYAVKSFSYFLVKKCSSSNGQILTIPGSFFRAFSSFFYKTIIEVILEGSFQNILANTGEIGNNYFYRIPNVDNKIPNDKLLENIQNYKNLFLNKKNSRRLYCFLYEFFQKNYNQLLRLESQLKDPENLNFLKNIWSFLGKKSQKLFTKQQITISLNQIDDYKRLFQSSEVYSQEKIPNIRFDDSTIPSEKTEILFKKLINNSDLREGLTQLERDILGNKIISIGVPNNFIPSIANSYVNELNSTLKRENDIFEINVYKIDLTRPGLVYFPQKFKFELSRFVSRDSSLILETNETEPWKLFPTKDLSNLESEKYVQYFSLNEDANFEIAFTGEKYSFLSTGDKSEIYKNHIMSYIIEIYLRILSGISLDESSVKERLNDSEILNLSNGIRNILGEQNIIVGTFNSNLQDSNFSSSEQIAQSVLTPKKFDRIFNVLVKNDFKIDYSRSIQSEEDLLTSGELNRSIALSFESYFVTLNLVGWE